MTNTTNTYYYIYVTYYYYANTCYAPRDGKYMLNELMYCYKSLNDCIDDRKTLLLFTSRADAEKFLDEEFGEVMDPHAVYILGHGEYDRPDYTIRKTHKCNYKTYDTYICNDYEHDKLSRYVRAEKARDYCYYCDDCDDPNLHYNTYVLHDNPDYYDDDE